MVQWKQKIQCSTLSITDVKAVLNWGVYHSPQNGDIVELVILCSVNYNIPWSQLKEDSNSKVKLYVCTVQDEMVGGRLNIWENELDI
jgi:hypothetical protein